MSPSERLDHRLIRVKAAFELESEALQPVEVLDTAVAVGADLFVIGID
jgi:hypothetical protein